MAKIVGKRVKVLVSLIAVGCGFLLLAFAYLRNLGSELDEIGASRYGEQTIQLGNGSRIYLKREVRGQNFDVVAVSENPNACDSANPETDLIFQHDANPLTVSQSEDKLFIFWAWGFNQPKHPIAGVVVKNIRPDSLSSEDKVSMKVQRIDVPLEFEKLGGGNCEKK